MVIASLLDLIGASNLTVRRRSVGDGRNGCSLTKRFNFESFTLQTVPNCRAFTERAILAYDGMSTKRAARAFPEPRNALVRCHLATEERPNTSVNPNGSRITKIH